jgi:hypothetical protein
MMLYNAAKDSKEEERTWLGVWAKSGRGRSKMRANFLAMEVLRLNCVKQHAVC